MEDATPNTMPESEVEVAECIICGEEKAVSIHIAESPMCEACVHETIITQFINALKHESAYPVRWGQYLLDPKDFMDYIKDAEDFQRAWYRKVGEYRTPLLKRLYCGDCHAFLGERHTPNMRILMLCYCEKFACSVCGEFVKNREHECATPVSSNPYADMVLGKDYQICPNADCRCPVELRDGCNAMHCTMPSCGQEFCFLCGVAVTHNDKSHWGPGSKCPRFGRPGDPRAIYDRPAPPPPPRRTTAAAILDAVRQRQGHQDLGRGLRDLVRWLPPLPAIPQLALIDENVPANIVHLAAEQLKVAQLLASERGILMTALQGQLDAMLQIVTAMDIDAETDGEAPPRNTGALTDIIVKLRMNLDVLVFQERVRADRGAYRRRHNELHDLFGQYEQDIARELPMLPVIMRVHCMFSGLFWR